MQLLLRKGFHMFECLKRQSGDCLKRFGFASFRFHFVSDLSLTGEGKYGDKAR